MIKRNCLSCGAEMRLNKKQLRKKYCGNYRVPGTCAHKNQKHLVLACQKKSKYSSTKRPNIYMGWLNA